MTANVCLNALSLVFLLTGLLLLSFIFRFYNFHAGLRSGPIKNFFRSMMIPVARHLYYYIFHFASSSFHIAAGMNSDLYPPSRRAIPLDEEDCNAEKNFYSKSINQGLIGSEVTGQVGYWFAVPFGNNPSGGKGHHLQLPR